MKKIGIISQARMTSNRLPKKVLMEVVGKTVLEHHIDRLKCSGYPIYVATTINQTDDVIVDLCKKLNIQFFRGSEQDVLSRYYECAKEFELDIIIRVTSDCPLIDGNLIREGLTQYLGSLSESFYISNCLTRSYPRGFDFEIFSIEDLKRANDLANENIEREHVTTFIRNKDKSPSVKFLEIKRLHDASRFRITLDEVDDWVLLKKLFEEYNCAQKSSEEIISILEKNPELFRINSHVEQKKV